MNSVPRLNSNSTTVQSPPISFCLLRALRSVVGLLLPVSASHRVVETLCYKPEGRGFDSRWSSDLPIGLILPAALWPWGSTQPLTEMSTRNFLGGKERSARKADNLTAIYEPIV
jgi:hypothetical protein